jgi:hypothetical protein
MTRSNEAFELLRAANPVPGAVTARKRWRPARVALVLAALALCLLIVAPAVGIEVPRLDFWTAEKAPPKVVQDFETLSEGAPAGMDPGAIPGDTRKVRLANGQTLWVAPTRHGGFCTLGRTSGGCDKLGTVPLNVTWAAGRVSLKEMTRVPPSATIFDRISGYVKGKYAEVVEIRFTDGDRYRPELAWVSEPIDAGFFEYVIPVDRQRAGHEISTVVALDGKGRVVTQDDRRAEVPPPDALIDEKRAAIRVGDAVLWVAPTRYEGRCAWLELQGKEIPIAPCLPKGYDRQAVLGLSVHSRGGDAILAGACGYAAVELIHRDGSTRKVRCEEGLVLAGLEAVDLAGHVRAVDARNRPPYRSRLPVAALRPRP